jgi:hypothetical protein
VSRASGPLIVWGCLQLLLGAGLAAFAELVPALLFLGGAWPVLALAVWDRARPPRERPRLLSAISVPVVVLSVGLALGAVGFTAGLWLGLIGAEIALFGGLWLAREVHQERRWER